MYMSLFPAPGRQGEHPGLSLIGKAGLLLAVGTMSALSGCVRPATPGKCGNTPSEEGSLVSTRWRPLFDGKTLNGWHAHGEENAWRVENGEIIGELVKPSPYTYLVTDQEFKDFDLQLQMLFESEQGNSGVFFRSDFPAPKNKDKQGNVLPYLKRINIVGPQAEFAPPGQHTGRLYDSAVFKWVSPELTELQQAMHRFHEWNTMRITAIGDHVTVYLNGYLMTELRDYKLPPKGIIAFQLHAGRTIKVHFRDIQIRER